MVQRIRKKWQDRKYRGHKVTGLAAAVWFMLDKTEWLPDIATALHLPPDFFFDTQIAGYCPLVIAWFCREWLEFWDWLKKVTANLWRIFLERRKE